MIIQNNIEELLLRALICFQFKGKKTIKLEEQIAKIAVIMSSIYTQNYLRENISNN